MNSKGLDALLGPSPMREEPKKGQIGLAFVYDEESGMYEILALDPYEIEEADDVDELEGMPLGILFGETEMRCLQFILEQLADSNNKVVFGEGGMDFVEAKGQFDE